MEVNVNAENFEREVLQANQTVLVDFFATWCAPCQMLSPTIAEIAKERGAGLKVCKINVDESGELAARFGINSIPTLMVFVGGKITKTAVGYREKEEIEAMLAI